MTWVNDLAALFVEHTPSLLLTKRDCITANGHYLKKEDPKLFIRLYEALDSKAVAKLVSSFADHYKDLQEGAHRAELYDALSSALSRTHRDARPPESQPGGARLNDVISTDLHSIKLILNTRNRSKSFLYDPVKDIIHQWDYEIIKDRVRSILGAEGAGNWFQANTEDCVLTYRPYQPRLFREGDTQLFNSWSQAAWRKDWVPDPKAECPPLFREFLEHSLADEESRHFVQAWLRDAAFERAEPILVLCGAPGSGKNTLIQAVAGALVGEANFQLAQHGFVHSSFQSGIAGYQIFFLDEKPLYQDGRDVLKGLHNGLTTFERKGEDVGSPERIYASIALANNTASRIKLEYTDRKFYVPMLATQSLEKTWGRDKITEFRSYLAIPHILQQLASYLFHAFKPQAVNSFPKTELFKTICINSFPTEYRAFIHACTLLETFNDKLMARRRKRPDPVELQDFIQTYEEQFNQPLADLLTHGNGTWVARSKIYKKPEDDNVIKMKPREG